jgi:hypothetical protein
VTGPRACQPPQLQLSVPVRVTGEGHNVFAGGYVLDAELGRGATGTVYRARRPTDGRLVAVKVLDPALVGDAEMRARLAGEADAMAAVAHPNCVAVYDHGEDEAGAWIAMEYVHGANLAAVLARAGTLTAKQACGVLTGALAGLGHAHAVGVIHRDLKPDNILVDANGVSKLTDFGLVTRRGDPHKRWRPLEGTPAYMSPEQVRGEPLDARSDLYAAGAILYQLLIGHPPFQADTPNALIHAQVNAPPPPMDDLPAHIGRLVHRALAKDRRDRPASAQEFAEALHDAARHDLGAAWLAGAGIVGLVAGVFTAENASASTAVTATSTAKPTFRPPAGPRRKKAIAAGIAAAVVAAALVAADLSRPKGTRAPAALATAKPSSNLATSPPPPPTTISSPAVPPPVPALQAGCAGVSYFDARPGDQCAVIGGTLEHGGWTVTAGPLVASIADSGRAQLCSQLTAVNDGSEVNLMTGLSWSIETDPPGAASPTTAGTIGGTINASGYIQPGGTAHGTVCFADVGHPGQVLVVFYPAANNRALWITSR